MAIASYSRSGINAEFGNPGFPISSLVLESGSAGSGHPLIIVFIVANNPGTDVLPHGIASLTFLGSSDNADSDGNIGVTVTLTATTPIPDGIHYTSSGSPITFPDGFWATSVAATLISNNNPSISVNMQVFTSDTILPIDDPPTGPPDGIFPPSNLSASWAFGSGQFYVTLAWTDNSDNETGFGIERSEDDGSTWTLIATSLANITTYNDYSSPHGKPKYRIYSFNDTVRSIYSNIATLDFAISSISPNSSLIGFNPTAIITGAGIGQADSAKFVSRINSSLKSEALNVTYIDLDHISVTIPDAPNGPEFVDIIAQNPSGDTATLSSGYNYQIQFSWLLEDPFIPVHEGDKIKFSSAFMGANSAGLVGVPSNSISGFSGIKEIQLILLDSSRTIIPGSTIIVPNYDIIIQNNTTFWFYVPIGFEFFSGFAEIFFVEDGTQFSGSVLAGILQILFEDATGIYKLVSGQTDDILYFRAGYTTDIKLLMLPTDDEIIEDDFIELLSYPTKILLQDEDNSEPEDFSIISTLRTLVITLDTEIPSPFIKTAFLP